MKQIKYLMQEDDLAPNIPQIVVYLKRLHLHHLSHMNTKLIYRKQRLGGIRFLSCINAKYKAQVC